MIPQTITYDLSRFAEQYRLFDSLTDTFTLCEVCESRMVDNGPSLCPTCIETHAHCEHCDSVMDLESSVRVTIVHGSAYRNNTTDELWCEDCHDSYGYRCTSCSDHFSDSNHSAHTVHGDSYCERCYCDNFTSCESCDETMHQDDAFYSERSDRTLCQSCYHDSRGNDESEYVLSYHSCDRPGIRFHGKGPRYFGLEWELSTDDIENDAETMHSALSYGGKTHGWMEEDATVVGFEIISMPHDLDGIREYVCNLHGNFAHCNFKGKYGNGIHIHVSRDGYTNYAWIRATTFINSESNHEFIRTVARRNETSYWNLDSTQVDNRFDTGTHRSAVNFDNDETVEFRMFQSSTKVTNVLGYIEFIACLMEYAETAETDLSSRAFIAYAMQSEYGYLKLFLQSVNAIAA